jgi:hypothetical protein
MVSPETKKLLMFRTIPWTNWLDRLAGDSCLRFNMYCDCEKDEWPRSRLFIFLKKNHNNEAPSLPLTSSRKLCDNKA